MARVSDQCAICGRPLTDSHRRDVRFWLPDPVLAMAESVRAAQTWGNDVVMQVTGIGSFVRVLLPIRLVGDQEIVYGIWLGVREVDLRQAWEAWSSETYGDLQIDGLLANAIPPWGKAMLGAQVTARVLARDELPYVVTSSNETVGRMLSQEWPAADVLVDLPPG